MKKAFYLLFLLTMATTAAFAQNSEIKGFLYDKANGEPLIYTNVYLKGTAYGAVTDANGFFLIGRIPPGNYLLMATQVGYDTATENVSLKGGEILTRKLYLAEATQTLKTVEITTSRNTYRRENTVNVGLTQITPRDIKITASVGGEPDVAQYIQTVPGVVSSGDQGGQVFIRGGTLTQNLTLLDGMVVYNPFHSIGLYSIFDSDLLKTVDFYTAGFNAEYGGRTSSVIDAKTIDGNKNRQSGRVSFSPVAAKINLDGPIYKSKSGLTLSYLASVRHSYLDKIGDKLYPYAKDKGNKLGFGFTDVFGKVMLSANNGSKISVSGFDFQDRADIGAPNQFNWRNSGMGLNFLLIPEGSTALIGGQLAYSTYKINTSSESSAPRTSSIDALNGEFNFTYHINKSELKYGIGLIRNTTSYSSPYTTGLIYDYTAYNTEFYGYFKYRINWKKVILDPGLHLHYYGSLGEFSPEPRLGAKVFLLPNLKLKSSAGRYSQNLISTRSDQDIVNLFNGFISSPDQVSYPQGGTPSSKLQFANHFVIGGEWEPIKNLEIDLEGYVKNFSQIINVNVARRSGDDPTFVAEKGLARGIDFSFRFSQPRYELRGSYSLAKVTRDYGSLATYAPYYDRRHNVNLLGTFYPVKDRKDWEIDVRFNLGSGLPFTQTQAFYENVGFQGGIAGQYLQQNGQLGIYYGSLQDYNKGRLPFYHRLDVAIKKQFILGLNSRAEINIGATNVYNRANVFYIDRTNSTKRVNQLPILPYLALSASF